MYKVVVAVLMAAIAFAFYFLIFDDIRFHGESLRGKRVLVTGASTGIGEQLAYQYSKFGVRLMLTARREDVLEEVKRKCLSLGAEQVEIVAADMAVRNQRETIIRETMKRYQGLDQLVLNHVTDYPGNWVGDDEDLTRIANLFEINFMAYVHLASKFLDTLIENQGAIGIVSSVAGNSPMPRHASYTASKFALQGFFGALRQELIHESKNVSITICVLGLIDTESAMIATKLYTPKMDPSTAASASETALEIVKAVTTKATLIYYPFHARVGVMLYKFFPELTGYIIRHMIL